MRRWPRSAGPAQRPHASLPHQSGAGGSSHRGRLAVRSSPGHHHVPRPLEQKPVLNSNATERSQGKRGPRRGPRRGSRRPGHTHGGSQGMARPVQGREDGGPERSSAHSAPALEATPCDSTPVPFTSLGLDARLLEGVRDLGFVETRPIQSAVIPFALAGHDLIACAETGTGKTAAFVVPTLQWLVNAGAPLKACARDARETTMDARGSTAEAVAQPFSAAKSRVLVLAPTRELAVQIEDEIHGLAYHTTVTSAAVYGGVEMGAQERALKAGVDIIVATPGRLMDHMRQQNADLKARCSSSPARRSAPIASHGSSPPPACAVQRCTPIGARISAASPSRDSRAADSTSSSRPTSRRAGSTSTPFTPSSITKFRIRPRHPF